MAWVLILWMIPSTSPVITAEFTSKERCEAAAKTYIEKRKISSFISQIDFLCIEK
jgi:hypothetical protein